jgi:formamidopyrimidine-DNA glycosylase
MPELPEVETIRRELEREVVGKKIKTVEVTGKRTIRRQTPAEFKAKLEGAKIAGAQRKGKYLLLPLDTGDVLIIHLRMSGQLRRAAPKDPVDKHNHVTISFTQGGQLRFIDPRTFGEMFLATPDEITSEIEELSTLGVDPVETPMSWVDFGHLLRSKRMKLKAFLTDQSMVAGIGNIYADEILFDSGLRYDRDTPSPPRRSVGCTARWSRSCTRPSSTAVPRWPTRGTSTSTASRASTSSTTRCTTARSSRAVGAAATTS